MSAEAIAFAVSIGILAVILAYLWLIFTLEEITSEIRRTRYVAADLLYEIRAARIDAKYRRP